MPKKLIIVESPSKCKKIEGYAGSDFKCLATCGHIYTLNAISDIDLNNNYKPSYRIIKTKKKHLDAIKDVISKIDKENIYLATDPDREGEAIAWHLCIHFNLNIYTTKRVLFNEITKDAVQYAINSPTTINLKMVESQQARQTIDILVGFKTCPILWKYLGIGDKNSPLSAGRCQTPCLKLVSDLYEKERSKKLKEKYKLSVSFVSPNLIFSNEFPVSLISDDKDGCQKEGGQKEESNHVSQETISKFLLLLGNSCAFSLSRTSVKQRIFKSPIPLSTSLLQQKANQYLGMSPSVTMKTAQKLYEMGFITYMRTDSHRYSKEFITQAVNYIKNSNSSHIKANYKDYLISDPYSLEKHNKSDGNCQDGHESIRPTNIAINKDEINSLSQQESKLYFFIFYHTLQTFMTDCIISHYDLLINPILKNKIPKDDRFVEYIERTPININKLTLTTTLSTETHLGWKVIDTRYKKIINGDENVELDGESYGYNKTQQYNLFLKKLLNNNIILENDALKTIQLLPYISGENIYFSEANLVKELENKHIGRPSTFASLVEKIQSRHYVNKMNILSQEIQSRTYCFYNIGNKDTIEISNYQIYTSKQPSRLVIQELGRNVIAFCYSFFEPLFSYDFTALLERDLDLICGGYLSYVDVCKKCDDIIEKCIFSIHKNSETTISDKEKIASIKNAYKSTKTRNLGTHNNLELVIKSGVYGYYAQYGTEKYSLRNMNMIDIEDFKIQDVIEFIQKQNIQKETNLLREFDDKISIWRGKNNKGDYIMIKATHNKNNKYTRKPKFISLKKFDGDYLECDNERIVEFIKKNL